MTEKDLESGQTEDLEKQEPAVPAVSDLSDDQLTSQKPEGITEDRFNSLLQAQEERFNAMEERLERMAQSAKDRGISKNAQEISSLRQQLEALGGGDEAWNVIQQQAEQQTLLNRINQLEQQISQGAPARQPVQESSPEKAWQAEWREDSQKILDAAANTGVTLSTEEYNAAMHNNGVPFTTKGDAFAALNQAILRKARGEAITVAAVATEGGDVAQPPAPPAEPKTAVERFEQAKAAGDYEAMKQIQEERWANVEQLQKKAQAQDALRAAGLTAEDLIEQNR